MKNEKQNSGTTRHVWLRKMAKAEEEYVSISVGGMANDMGMFCPNPSNSAVAFGRLIEFARRAKELSLLQLAELADLELDELLVLERGVAWLAEPRTVYQLATVLNLPYGRLQELSGLAKPRDNALAVEAVRFAAKSESTAELSSDEREALESFVSVLVELDQKDKKT